MPKQYDAMKKKFMEEGMSEDEAQEKAARIYNAQRKPGQKPVGRYEIKGGHVKKGK